jgi:Mrp family chromosome partitioning ATPase
MLFREVIPEVDNQLRAQAWLGVDHEVTLLRDLHGRVRLMVESPDTTADEPRGAALEAALRNALGGWLGDATPVWVTRKPRPGKTPPFSALADLVRNSRRPHTPATGASFTFTCFLLDRHAGKRGWVGEIPYAPPWPITDVDAKQKPAILVFFSHKGGVGRSTALAATAVHFARAGLQVMAIDLDLEAPGLAALFGKSPDVGVVDYLVEQPLSGDALLATIALPVGEPTVIGDNGKPILVVPAGKVDGEYLDMLAKLDLQDATAPGGLVDRLKALFHGLTAQYAGLDFILVDARAGFHDLGGVMLAGLSHGAIVVGLDNPQSWQGVAAVVGVLAQPLRQGGTDPVNLVLVLGMGPPAGGGGEDEHRAFRERAHDILTDKNYYPTPRDVPKPGEPYYADLLRWRPELRGKGGALDAGMVEVLLSDDYRGLAARIAALYGRPLPERKG